MPKRDATLDRVFRSLSDPTRRAVLERLCRSPAPVTELAAPFDMALPSFIQHLEVLEESGLVRSEKNGRVRTYRIAPGALRGASTWLSRQRALWDTRLDQLDDYLLDRRKRTRK
jgi:DNA-binding transcriptional ArsR family regulator